MEYYHINKDKIIEAFYLKPYEPDSEMPFGEKHGYRIVLIIGYNEEGYPIKTCLDKDTEEECIAFINNLGFTRFY